MKTKHIKRGMYVVEARARDHASPICCTNSKDRAEELVEKLTEMEELIHNTFTEIESDLSEWFKNELNIPRHLREVIQFRKDDQGNIPLSAYFAYNYIKVKLL